MTLWRYARAWISGLSEAEGFLLLLVLAIVALLLVSLAIWLIARWLG